MLEHGICSDDHLCPGPILQHSHPASKMILIMDAPDRPETEGLSIWRCALGHCVLQRGIYTCACSPAVALSMATCLLPL